MRPEIKWLLSVSVIIVILICMAEFTWGDLPKNQIDNQLITEAITEAIAEHEADPDAHLGVGESLEQHKTNEVLDHPAYSVVDDKPIINKFSLLSYFENITCFSITGSAFNYLGYMELYTTTSLNSVAQLRNQSDDQTVFTTNKAKNPIFEIVGYINSNVDYEGRVGMGTMVEGDGVGFKFSGTTAYAFYIDENDGEHTIELSGINPKVLHKWRVEMTGDTGIIWIVDNVQVASVGVVSPVPQNMQNGAMFTIWVKHLTASQIVKFVGYRLLFQQDFL